MTRPEEDSGLFSGVRFLLAGFEPPYENQFIEELEENGGENARTYETNCTHVIVSNLTHDDPICAAARKDGKALVTELWVPDCLDNDALADVSSVLYRPLRDLDGIPGSENLCICLTGYQGQERQKIMEGTNCLAQAQRMVELIGARFTKPLLGNLVTHLICYKFEGEKYELAQKTGLKLINHFWLEDCLKTWTLLPEADYSRSGWEMEREAEQPRVHLTKAAMVDTPASQSKVKERTSASEKVRSPTLAQVSTGKGGGVVVQLDISGDCRSPPREGHQSRISPNANPSSPKSSKLQARDEFRQDEGTGTEVNQLEVAPDWTPSMDDVRRNITFQDAEVLTEASVPANQKIDATGKSVHVEGYTGLQYRRRSSYAGTNQGTPEVWTEASLPVNQNFEGRSGDVEGYTGLQYRRSSYGGTGRGTRGSSGLARGEVIVKQCATIDSAMELMNLCTDPVIRSKVTVAQDLCTSVNNTGHNEDDFDSPESKRRKFTLSRMGLSSPGPDMTPNKRQHPSLMEQLIYRSAELVAIELVAERKISSSEMEIHQEVLPGFDHPVRAMGGDAMDVEALGSVDPAIVNEQPMEVQGAPDDISFSGSSFKGRFVKQSATGVSMAETTIPEKEVLTGNLQTSPPKADSELAPVKESTKKAPQVSLQPSKYRVNFQKDVVAERVYEEGEEERDNVSFGKDVSSKPASMEKSINMNSKVSDSRPGVHRKKVPKISRVSPDEQDKENVELHKNKHEVPLEEVAELHSSKKGPRASLWGSSSASGKKFAVGGSTDERKNLHYLIRLLGAKLCNNRYQWKDDTTHVILPAPLRRTEKFLAAAAAGRWILRPEYMEASRKAGKFVDEQEHEWFGGGTNDKGTISLEAPRKWRLHYATTRCGPFHGLRVVVYGECMSPPLETLKRAVRAGGGVVLATSPPYFQHLLDGVDFAIVNPDTSKMDEHVQDFLKHKVACVMSDYFVDFICHPSFSLKKHILYGTNLAVKAAEKRLQSKIAQGPTEYKSVKQAPQDLLTADKPKKVQAADDTACVVCRRTDDEEVMLLCGDGKGRGCGLATHIHCCSTPLATVPEEDWFCRNCEDL